MSHFLREPKPKSPDTSPNEHAFEYELSPLSQELAAALYAPIDLQGSFRPDNSQFAPTPLDPAGLSIGGMNFMRVSQLYLDAVFATDYMTQFKDTTVAALQQEVHYETERRLQKNKVNIDILSRVLQERIDSDSTYDATPTITSELLGDIYDARAGYASLEQRARLLAVVPEMGSIEVAKTTCPCDAPLATQSAKRMHEQLAWLIHNRPDWQVEFTNPRNSHHRIVSELGAPDGFDERIIVSKWVSARIKTATLAMDLVTKQSNILFEPNTAPVHQSMEKTYKGITYDAQPCSIMHYLRLSTEGAS